ncbi:NAD(P)H-dependent oxidoreductase [Oceanicaulis alexandrii]|uniref:FMN-dependent NADH-azoreductase n=1 Tax=Oceanicaulis alexandrii TaxID=153233 RepID=UPI0035D08EB6
MHVLRVDASVRKDGSLSRKIGDAFMEALRKTHPAVKLTERDVGLNPPPIITSDWVAAAFTPQDDRSAAQSQLLAPSDQAIAELRTAEIILITAPMYNYGMPAGLKAWVDSVVRKDKTFTFDLARGDFPLEPVLSGKTLVLATAWGEFGFEPGGVRDGQGHLVGHVKAVSGYLGAARLEHVGVEYQEFADDRFEASLQAALERATELGASL